MGVNGLVIPAIGFGTSKSVVTALADASGDVPAGTASVPFTATATNAPTGTQFPPPD